MEEIEIELAQKDINKIADLVREYVEPSPQSFLKRMIRDLDLSSSYSNRLEYDELFGIVDDMVIDINESGKSYRFIEYLKEQFPSGYHRFDDILVKYLPEEGEEGTFVVPLPDIGKKIDSKISPESLLDPTMGQSVYEQILNVIYEIGIGMQQHVNSYNNKEEPELRDNLLVSLQPHLESSVTGESFNKSGKTDILIKRGGVNLFVAECKIWSGESNYLDAIDQLFNRYVTLQDSKTALIVFVRTKNISQVIEKIKDQTKNHRNYIKFVNSPKTNWFNYLFHMDGDKEKLVKLAIIVVHIPV